MAFVPPVYCPIDLSKQILTVHVLYQKKTSKCGPKSGLKVFFPFLFFLFFKGQVRWPEGPPHFALDPPYLFFFCFF